MPAKIGQKSDEIGLRYVRFNIESIGLVEDAYGRNRALKIQIAGVVFQECVFL